MYQFSNTQFLMFQFFQFLAERTANGVLSIFETEIQENSIVIHSGDDDFIADLNDWFDSM